MPKKKTRKTPKQKAPLRPTGRGAADSYNKPFWAIVLLILIVCAIAGITRFLVPRVTPTPSPDKPLAKPMPTPPRYEVFPLEKPRPVKPIPRPPREKKRPKVAIIIDDMGYDRKMVKKFLALDAALTYAILPFSPYQSELSKGAKKKGREIMLHLPMEPVEYPTINPGPGALLTTMSPDELIAQLQKDLLSVPGAKGVNNHMGSRMTAESVQLYQIFSVLKKENLFFIDSRTTAATLCRPSARLLRIPFAERNVFLDHKQNADSIRKKIKELILVAGEKGEAVGIGHPHRVTYKVLREMLPEIKRKVTLVPASEVTHLQS